ncbi:MAG: ammonia-forming cytochrome c nitrite reductase subunit c552 [Gammaproteobacteria bacterium]|nr:ammonia-forming cytochrome c nitrite reductase subunit c552 [Gammaproteobacteria bacterium]
MLSINTTNRVKALWLVWGVATMAGVGVFSHIMLKAEDKSVFMPGPLSDGHHQLADSCDSCHTDSFGGGPVVLASCIDCHGDERQKPFDSHPKAKFNDPRNADLLATIDATNCITCHTEHKPEFTLANGLTRPKDLCFHCHEEIAEERPSHEGMGFETCASSGCHNFHDNRALYTEFLIKHAEATAYLDSPLVPEKDFVSSIELLLAYPRDDYPTEAVQQTLIDAPSEYTKDESIVQDWSVSGHALQGVNCSACHSDTLLANADSQETNEEGDDWIASPSMDSCAGCHNMEVDLFVKGKHGMRLGEGLDPMSPSMARLPMHSDAEHSELTCNSCHAAHTYDVVTASVESCLGCHSDQHSIAYKESSHFALWLAEVAGDAEAGSGVSCATCHMPRTNMDVDDYNARIVVNHNQSATLSPNSKMIRPACMECHGLEFSINALADRTLIENNFKGQPTMEIQSVNLARELQKAHEARKAKQ